MFKINNKSIVIFSLFITLFPSLISSAKAIEFPDAPKREAPQSTAAGGRRGGCVSGMIPIMALSPNQDNAITTVSAQPDLFVYIPPTKAKLLQFMIKDEAGNTVDNQEISIFQNDRVMMINVGEKVNLETGKKYTWEVSLICNPMAINTSTYTKGSIERVTLEDSIKKELSAQQDTLKKAEIYASNKVWQETISLVAKVKESQPQQWQELLTSVGLENIADKEFAKEEAPE